MNHRRIHSILGMGPNPCSKQTFYISVNITYIQDVPFQTRNHFVIRTIVVLKVGRCIGSTNENWQWAVLLPPVQFIKVYQYREDFHHRVFVNDPHQWKGSDPGEWVILAGLTVSIKGSLTSHFSSPPPTPTTTLLKNQWSFFYFLSNLNMSWLIRLASCRIYRRYRVIFASWFMRLVTHCLSFSFRSIGWPEIYMLPIYLKTYFPIVITITILIILKIIVPFH